MCSYNNGFNGIIDGINNIGRTSGSISKSICIV
jgi:hypothetical protein